jgi:mono/diheme cytochrome c family protein
VFLDCSVGDTKSSLLRIRIRFNCDGQEIVQLSADANVSSEKSSHALRLTYLKTMKGSAICLSVMLSSFATAASLFSNHPTKAEPVTAPSASQLYSKHCAECHGKDGRAQTSKGRFSHARNLTDAKWQDDVSDERIFNSIMNGRNVRGNMPSFSEKLNQQDTDALVSFVRKFKK